jgi:hypothetical protein
MAPRKRSAKQRPDWERYAVEVAKMWGFPKAEVTQIVQDMIMRMVVRKTAEQVVERSYKDLIAPAATTPISVDDIKKAHESLLKEKVRRKKGHFPQDEQ